MRNAADILRAFAACTARPNGRKSMLHKLVIGGLGAMAVMFSGMAFAQGTATEAKAMLDRLLPP